MPKRWRISSGWPGACEPASQIKTDGHAYINAEPAPATAAELRDLALLLLATADELDVTAKS